MTHGTLRFLLSTALVLAGIAWSPSARAQDEASTGTVTGVVVEEGRGEPLPGANVRIKDTAEGTSTDLNGRYRLDGLAPGAYDLVFSFVGFQRKTVTGVEVTAGSTVKLEVALA